MTERWGALSSQPRLSDTAVHVWQIPLTASAGEYTALSRLLHPDERSRAERFLGDQVRRRFVVGRARLRHLLGAYLGMPPRAVTLTYGNLGKPLVPQTGRSPTLHFNFSNSADLALAAFTFDCELGVDVECVRKISSLDDLVRRFFAPPEIEQVLSAGDLSSRHLAFFRCWTRKEAYLKAVGKGLTFPIHQVCVTVHEDQPVRIVDISGDESAAAQWQLESLSPGEGSIGALALLTGDAPRRIDCYGWTESLAR